MAVFWDIAPYSFVNIYRRFRSDYDTHYLTAGYIFPKHSLTDVCGPMALIFVDSLRKYELTIFPALVIIPFKCPTRRSQEELKTKYQEPYHL
jgi:hypothetical protein